MNLIPIPSMLNLIRKELSKQTEIEINTFKIVILIQEERVFFEVPKGDEFNRFNCPETTKHILFNGIQGLAKKYKNETDEKNDYYKDYTTVGIIVNANKEQPFFEMLLKNSEDHKTKLKFNV